MQGGEEEEEERGEEVVLMPSLPSGHSCRHCTVCAKGKGTQGGEGRGGWSSTGGEAKGKKMPFESALKRPRARQAVACLFCFVSRPVCVCVLGGWG